MISGRKIITSLDGSHVSVEVSATEMDEIRHRQHVADAVRKAEWPGENFETMEKVQPKKRASRHFYKIKSGL